MKVGVGIGTGAAVGGGVDIVVPVWKAVGTGVGLGVRVGAGACAAGVLGSIASVGDRVGVGTARVVAAGVDASTAGVAVGTIVGGRLSTAACVVASKFDVGGTTVAQAAKTSDVRPTSRQRRTINSYFAQL